LEDIRQTSPFKWGFEADWPVNGKLDGQKDIVNVTLYNAEHYTVLKDVCGHKDANNNPYNALYVSPIIRRETLEGLAGERPKPPQKARPGAITGEIKLTPKQIEERNQLVQAWDKYEKDLSAYNTKLVSVDLTNDGIFESPPKIERRHQEDPFLKITNYATKEEKRYMSFKPYTFVFNPKENKFIQTGLDTPLKVTFRDCYELASN
jgi:hypothetical protein